MLLVSGGIVLGPRLDGNGHGNFQRRTVRFDRCGRLRRSWPDHDAVGQLQIGDDLFELGGAAGVILATAAESPGDLGKRVTQPIGFNGRTRHRIGQGVKNDGKAGASRSFRPKRVDSYCDQSRSA